MCGDDYEKCLRERTITPSRLSGFKIMELLELKEGITCAFKNYHGERNIK